MNNYDTEVLTRKAALSVLSLEHEIPGGKSCTDG